MRMEDVLGNDYRRELIEASEAADGRFFVELWELLQQMLHNGKTLLIGKKLL